MKVNNYLMVENGDMSEDIFSSPVELEYSVTFAIQLKVSSSATLTGTFSIQASCDPVSDRPVNWTTLTDHDFSISGDGTGIFNIENCGYSWVRVIFASSTGSGTLNVRINRKGF